VPAIFVGGEFVGGCNDGGMGGAMSLDREGKLKPLLSAAGAL
jgi:glutaredoxin-related protein|tara:strand:- start:285 stop:410 length:126 start_codon:yes stop_codon:yes gene_type:complete